MYVFNMCSPFAPVADPWVFKVDFGTTKVSQLIGQPNLRKSTTLWSYVVR